MTDYQILQTALSGRPLSDLRVVDCHGHLDWWKAHFRFGVDAESMLATMDRIGIDLLCINKWNCPDIRTANDDVAAVVKKYPDRFVGFAATTPSWNKQKMIDEMNRCFNDLGFTGIKVHNGYETISFREQSSLPEYHEALEAIWTFAATKRCPVLCHGFVTPEIADRHPTAMFIVAHALGQRTRAHEYAQRPNVYFDTASSMNLRGNLEYFVQTVGVERILFGSDMPYANPAYRIGQVIGTEIPDGPMKKILGENMTGLLEAAGWRK